MNSDRLKFRVWDENGKKYRNDFTIDAEGRLRSLWNNMVIVDMPYVIEQCTGLRDKNGKLIFEGDIVQEFDGNNGKPEGDPKVIGWAEAYSGWQWCFVDEKGESVDFYGGLAMIEYYTVIGNVHEGAGK